MGIRITLFFLALQLGLSAQITHDTIYFSGKKFVKHIVKGGESLNSIARLHQIKTTDIISSNNLSNQLFYNQLLYIPIYLNTSVSNKDIKVLNYLDSDSNITNIGLLMPYYLLSNDTMFNNDTLDISNRYYTKSEAALSFHIGVELALDSLRKKGKKIVLHTFDTNQESIEVNKIILSNQLAHMDIIIGPMYSKYFQMVCEKYGNDSSKRIISPLSRNDQGIQKFPSVYQIALTYKTQLDILIDYLIQHKLQERIIILNDSNETSFVAYAKYRFEKKNRSVEAYELKDTKVDEIREYFEDYQNILLLSRDQFFISKVLGSIGSIDSTSTIFAFESIMSYKNLDINNLMELNVHIPNSKAINLLDQHDLDFVLLFEKKFGTNSRKYSKEGYDIIMHFCGEANLYQFYQFEDSYKKNISAPIYYYSNYDLVPADK